MANVKLKKLHLGCGTIAPSDWINIDNSWNAWLAKYPILKKLIKISGLIRSDLLNIPWPKNIIIYDLTKTLSFDNNSVDCIYSSHTLEHLYLEQAKNLLKECFRILKPGGIVRIVVPDLKAFTQDYLNRNTSADTYLEKLRLRQTGPPTNLVLRIYNKLNDTNSHKWMYDKNSLTHYLKLAGFKNIQSKKLYQSKIIDIRQIEQPGRLSDAICLEAEKF